MIIAWFSCGATSAVSCKIALNMYADFSDRKTTITKNIHELKKEL